MRATLRKINKVLERQAEKDQRLNCNVKKSPRTSRLENGSIYYKSS